MIHSAVMNNKLFLRLEISNNVCMYQARCGQNSPIGSERVTISVCPINFVICHQIAMNSHTQQLI